MSDQQPAPPTSVDLRAHRPRVCALVLAAQRAACDESRQHGRRASFTQSLHYRGVFECFDNIIADFIDKDLGADALPPEILAVCDALDEVEHYPNRFSAPQEKSGALLLQLAQLLVDLAEI